MEIMTTTAVYHNKEMDLSGGNSSFREDNAEDEYNVYTPMITTLPISLKIVSLVIYSLAFVLGVLGNGVVICMTGFKMKKTVNTVWYLNLAVADFIVTAFLPLRITDIVLNLHWPFGKFMCKMSGTVFYLNMFASIYTLVVISVDRCVCVLCPVWAQNHRSVRKASWVSLGVWVQALAFSSPIFIFRDTLTSDYDKDVIWCFYSLVSTGNYSAVEVNQLWAFRAGVMIMVYVLMGFVVPFTVIVSCYSIIIYRLRNNRSMASQSGPSFKIIAAVITAFFLCWAPFNIMHLIMLMDFLTTEFSGTLNLVTTIGISITFGLAVLNSCLNPLLYVFMGQDFKDVFRKSVLKVLEKAFAEDLPQNNTSTNPGSSIYETALSQIKV